MRRQELKRRLDSHIVVLSQTIKTSASNSLWSEPDPVPHWEYRQAGKKAN